MVRALPKSWLGILIAGGLWLHEGAVARAQEPLDWGELQVRTDRADDELSQFSPANGSMPGWAARSSPKTLFSWNVGPPQPMGPVDENAPLVTDRPDFTEASTTVGLGRVQLEAGYTFVRNDDNGVRETGHSIGETLLRVGMMAEWLEVRIAWTHAVQQTQDSVSSLRASGGDDLYLGVKIALTEQAGWLPEMVLMPQMRVPTGHSAFTAGQVLPGVNWLYGWEVNDFLAIGGSTQANRASDDDGFFYVETAQSLTANYGLTDKLGAYTEWFAFFPCGAHAEGIGAEHYFDTGLTYQVNPDLQFDIRAGWGLNPRAEDFFTGAGLAKRW